MDGAALCPPVVDLVAATLTLVSSSSSLDVDEDLVEDLVELALVALALTLDGLTLDALPKPPDVLRISTTVALAAHTR